MKFSLLTFPKLLLYVVVLLFVSLILFAWIFVASWAEIQAKWEQVLALFVFCSALIKHIFKRLFYAKRLNYNPKTQIFLVEKWAWQRFSWQPEQEFTHDELLGVYLFKSEGEIWLVNQEKQFCAFLGETSDSRRAKILCEKIAYRTQLYFLPEKSIIVVRQPEKYFFENKV